MSLRRPFARLAVMVFLAVNLALPAAPAMAMGGHGAAMNMASPMMTAPDAEQSTACQENDSGKTSAPADKNCCTKNCGNCACTSCFSTMSGLVDAFAALTAPSAPHLRQSMTDTVTIWPASAPESPPKRHT